MGKERGFIDPTGHLKVLLKNEGVWIKVIAISNNKKKVIGVLQNQPFGVPGYGWGDLVLAQEKNPKQLADVIKKVSGIPGTGWSILTEKVKI